MHSIYHYVLSFAGAVLFRNPSRNIFVLGVTGTKGKSTTIEIINSILEVTGKKTALISSIRCKVGEESETNTTGNTMPGRFAIQKFLRRAVNSNCDYALVEVTSQGILQYRHRFVNWGGAMFTNLAPEHIEAHGTFEKYRDSKVEFFKYVIKKNAKATFFVNKDDGNTKYFMDAAKGGNVLEYSASNITTELAGDFNKYNIGAAVSFCESQGINKETIKKAVTGFSSVPGRMEYVQKEPFSVVIDYAHTPDSLRKVYSYLKTNLGKNRRMICVLGSAGGGRDKWKRPEMGKIAAEYCNEIILTDEDPFDENPEEIIKDLKSGILSTNFIANTYEILDRREALEKAVSLAEAGDTIIATGKGSEEYIRVSGGRRMPWNERKVLEELL